MNKPSGKATIRVFRLQVEKKIVKRKILSKEVTIINSRYYSISRSHASDNARS